MANTGGGVQRTSGHQKRPNVSSGGTGNTAAGFQFFLFQSQKRRTCGAARSGGSAVAARDRLKAAAAFIRAIASLISEMGAVGIMRSSFECVQGLCSVPNKKTSQKHIFKAPMLQIRVIVKSLRPFMRAPARCSLSTSGASNVDFEHCLDLLKQNDLERSYLQLAFGPSDFRFGFMK